MLEEFKKYVSKYDLNNEKIKLKYNHSLRVMNLSEKYAKLLGFSEEDIEIAKIIGLLHDFGRFEQLKVYDSFNDLETVDHADYSIKQLFDKGEIRKFVKDDKNDELIKFAIKNHNKFKLPEIDDERVMMHAKLIRDVDKIDIVYLLGFLGELNDKATKEQLSPVVIESIRNHYTVNRSLLKNHNDHLATTFAYAFDIYNDLCLPEIKQNLKWYYEQIEGEEVFKEVYDIIIKYIDERIENNVR